MTTFIFKRIPAIGLALIFGLSLLFSSCSSSNDVASSHFLQKRKHRPGVHLNRGKKHLNRQHAQAQKEGRKTREHLELTADVLNEKAIQTAPDSLKAMKLPVLKKRKKLLEEIVRVHAKRPILQKIAPKQFQKKSLTSEIKLNKDEPFGKKKEGRNSTLGNLAFIAGVISIICLALASVLWIALLSPLALIPFLLSIVSGIVGVITGSLTMKEQKSGKVGLILSTITLGLYGLIVLLFIVLYLIIVIGILTS